MQEISVTNFKNQALKILDEIARTGKEVILTRHGKPLAHVEPAPATGEVVLGKLKGAMTLNEDIVAPIGDADWDACR